MNTPNITAIVLRNTVDSKTADVITMDMYFSEVKEPMVVFIDENKQLVEGFRIVARNHSEIDYMIKYKIFYTDSIPSGEVGKQFGAVFYGTTFDEMYRYEKPTVDVKKIMAKLEKLYKKEQAI